MSSGSGADNTHSKNDGDRKKEKEDRDMSLLGVLVFGFIGATATTLAATHLRRTIDFFVFQERIRRMQSVFNRERNKHQRNNESWRENDRGTYTQNFQREDWYWTTNNSYSNYRRTNFREAPKANPSYQLSHHYAILGLDRARTEPYTESEIKNAFRKKAMQFHPDQNQGNKEVAEAKFKEVMVSYEAIKAERKNMKQ